MQTVHYTYRFEHSYYVVYRVAKNGQSREVAKYLAAKDAVHVAELLTTYAEYES